MPDQSLFGTTTQVVKMPGATFTIKGAPEGSVLGSYDEPDVERMLFGVVMGYVESERKRLIEYRRNF